MPFGAAAQRQLSGRIVSAANGEALTFATVKFGEVTDAVLSDLEGNFKAEIPDQVSFLTISYLGFKSKTVQLAPGNNRNLVIRLEEREHNLDEVVIAPPYEKIRAIIRRAVTNRALHKPDLYDWYQCNLYHKMVADIYAPDSVLKDTTKAKLAAFLADKHILVSETYSRRSYERPNQLQDEVLATRVSGWQKAPFVSLVTDILPFDAYSDFFKLNGRDYPNPVSNGWSRNYDFDLVDEVLQGADTLYILAFRPRKGKEQDALRGQVYIHSREYAIAYFTGVAKDATLSRSLNIEQQYQYKEGHWFPEQLNYEIDWRKFSSNKKGSMGLLIKGTSRIDSLRWQRPARFHFDKAKTVKLAPGADDATEQRWQALRPDTLSYKERETYRFVDSVFKEAGIEKLTNVMDKLSEAKVPVGPIDIDLRRIYSLNGFERSRLGLGLQTNERVLSWMSLGGWLGYGTGDKQWKYGGFAELYLDAYKDKTIRFGYDNDLVDPGRIRIHKDIDRNYLQQWAMSRADKVEDYYISGTARMGYWTAGLEGHYQQITPQYDYRFYNNNEYFSTFRAREASLNLRYAYAERRVPVFRHYVNSGTRYPVLYLKLTAGNIYQGENYSSNYMQALAAVKWSRHWAGLGNESFLLMAGGTLQERALPLSKLFAGRGFRNKDLPLYSFGSFITMAPYDVYTDRFISINWKHDFDWRLYNLENISRPYISLAHNFLIGSLDNPLVRLGPEFSVPTRGYNESGILLNDLVKINYVNIAHLNLQAGFFYHWTKDTDLKKNGKFVLGISMDF